MNCQFVGYFFGKLFINILLIEKNVESFNKVKLIEGNLFSVNTVAGINLSNDKYVNNFNLIQLKHLISEFENLTKMEEASREKMFGSSLVSGAFSIIMHHLRIHSQCGIRPILNSFFMHYISSSQIKFLD